MATKVADVLVEFNADDKDLKKASTDASASLNALGSEGGKIGSKLSSGFKLAAGAMAGLAVAGTTALAGLVTQSTKLYSELEQNMGGTEAVFGEGYSYIESKAYDAYKNMGLSASDYMSTANKMGSLFQGSGIEQTKAMNMTAEAMQRAADVASVMGVDMDMAMESIAGAAKGNFTMMDNLGVAMNATALDAYALEKGINFNWNTASQAEKAELAMQMFMDRTSQYAGNFAKESEQTISGSIGMMKSSWENLMAGFANPDQSGLDGLVTSFVDSLGTVAKNILPVVQQVLSSIGAALPGLVSQIMPILTEVLTQIVSMITTVLPTFIPLLIEGALSLFMALVNALPLIIPALTTGLITLITSVINLLPTVVPLLLTAAIQLFMALVNALPTIFTALSVAIPQVINSVVALLPTFLPQMLEAAIQMFMALVEAVPIILDALIEALPQVIDAVVALLPTLVPALLEAAIALFLAFVEALPQIITALVDAIPTVIQAVIDMLPTLIPQLLAGALQLFMALVQAVPQILGSLLSAVGSLIGQIPSAIIKGASALLNAGKQMMQGLINGIKAMGSKILDTILGPIKGAADAVLSFLGIKSPSKLFRYFGQMTGEGLVEGIAGMAKSVVSVATSLADSAASAVGGGLSNIGKMASAAISGNTNLGTMTASLDVSSAQKFRAIGNSELIESNNGGRSNQPLIGQIIVPEGADPMAFAQQIGAQVRFA